MNADAPLTAERLFERFFAPLYPRGADLAALRKTDANPAENPAIFAEWLGGECPPSVVEEMIRWRGPVLCFRRTSSEDHELHGQTVRAGDQVAGPRMASTDCPARRAAFS